MREQIQIEDKSIESKPLSHWPVAIAMVVFALHLLSNQRYGFHRDELQTLDDARHLAWGFVTYPPLTPFFGRLSLMIFGISVWGARLFPALAQVAATIIGGRIARELGGGRFAQSVAALGVATTPLSLAAGALLQYVTFDYLWWVLVAFFLIRMLRTGDTHNWIGIGVAVGLGMMTKYSMLFLVAGMLVALAVTPSRKLLATRWLWIGIAVSLLILLPNAIWQIQHNFISYEFLQHIHARDIRMGRTAGFLKGQFEINTNFLMAPVWLAGLYFCLRSPRFRAVGWTFLFTIALFVAGQGRAYYAAPLYPMLLAAGAVLFEGFTATPARPALRIASVSLWVAGGILLASLVTPVAPAGSRWFRVAAAVDGDFVEEFGWPELVREVWRIYSGLPADQRAQTGILATNYGEAGAISLYGPQYGLPTPISGTNTFYLRGYGDHPPKQVIVLGADRDFLDAYFSRCIIAGHSSNPLGLRNEESGDHPDIFLCDGMRVTWPEFWKHFRLFG